MSSWFRNANPEDIRAAIKKAGLFVVGTKPDGTIMVSDRQPVPAHPELIVVPLDPRARSREYGTIYFISDGEFIKIGFAEDWHSRLKDLQVANARRLTPLLVLEGGGRMEKHLHWLFRAYRVAGEWFRPAPELLAYIEERKADGLPLGGAE